MAYKETELEPSTLIALFKGAEKLSDDLELKPGIYPIDATLSVRLQGAIERAADGETTEAPKFNWPLVLTLICKRARLTREQAAKVIAESFAVAGGLGAGIPELIRDRVLDADVAVSAAKLAGSTKKHRRGATTGKVIASCVLSKR